MSSRYSRDDSDSSDDEFEDDTASLKDFLEASS